MNLKQGLWVGLGMVFCVCVGIGMEHVRLWLFVPELAEPVATEIQTAEKVRPRVVTVRDESAVRDAEALRKRVAELEKALTERDSAKAAIPPAQETAVSEERPRRQSWKDRMEQLKKDNPAQYAEMQKRREEFRQGMEQREMDRADFLAAVDVKNMTSLQRENHEKLLATVARVNELMAQMGEPGSENSAVRQEMGATMGLLHDLYGQERSYLLEATAKSIGYEGDEATAFAEQIQTIIDNTTMMGPHIGHGGPRGR